MIITSIYAPFWGTEQFERSCRWLGTEAHNVHAGKPWNGNGQVLRYLHGAARDLPRDEPLCYADGADSFLLRYPVIPTDHLLYQTEKACYPQTKLADLYLYRQSAWCFLNGGGWAGPAGLVAEFFERYGLTNLRTDCNGQHEQHLAYLKARGEGFPVLLDQRCREFQSIAFSEPGELWLRPPEHARGDPPQMVYNTKTGTYPAVLHGNGRTDMDWVYKLRQI